jgi:hypothetical protein
MKTPLALALFLLANTALAADTDFMLTIHGHRFEPAELTVPAAKKIRLRIENRDATAEEFESHELNREKVIPGNSSTTIFIGPLAPGRYPFFGEFNKDTAQGALLAQ